MPASQRPPTRLESLKPELLNQLSQRSVVLSAPTGTGKSTWVPGWLPGNVLVIEPRRVACRALANRVAELEGQTLGQEVGYRVRHDDRSSADTRILFATPGIVLSDASCLDEYDVVVLDEFHERRLDTDWLLAFLMRQERRFLVMSATIAGDRIAKHIRGVHLAATSQSFPVENRYLGAGSDLPYGERLSQRLVKALTQAEEHGDILVFLPGKAEIRQARSALAHLNFQLFELHGGLPLSEQSKVFEQTPRRKLILSTNVAETSLTLPNVKTVIDSGLVRRTHYHGGRGYLALSSIAMDSAQQRSGRAGRTAPGVCLRLWGKAAQLEATTAPEIQRESLVPFVLWSAANGVAPEQLPCLDPPAPFALSAARQELQELQALDIEGRLTERGQSITRLPLDPWYGRLLVEAQGSPEMPSIIDLVAALTQAPPLMLPAVEDPKSVLPCDASALIECIRAAPSSEDPFALREARQTRARLRQMFGLRNSNTEPFDPQALLKTILRADPRSAYVARLRKRQTQYSAGGTELELGKDSRAGFADAPEAIVVLGTRAAMSGRKKRLIATRATAVSLKLLDELGLGALRVGQVSYKSGKLRISAERVYAGKVIGKKELCPSGELLRSAVTELFLRGSYYPKSLKACKQRLQRRELLFGLSQTRGSEAFFSGETSAPPGLSEWVPERLKQLGLNTADELELLSEEDLLCEDVGAEARPMLEREYPLQVDVGDCLYRADYDVPKRQLILTIVKGKRATPPPRNFLPRFPGFKVFVEAAGTLHALPPRA